MPRRLLIPALLLFALALGGCLERRLLITSEPPGARVWVSDIEVGKTPVEVAFEHYGEYDVRLALDGYEPLRTTAEAHAPFYEWPGPDLVATALPWTVSTTVRWNFRLAPSLESTQDPDVFRAKLLERARELGARAESGDAEQTITPAAP